MKNSFKGPLFFCENCGSPVHRDAKKCPHCGRFFSSVRCPSCNFTGSEALFSEGCPMCGYSSPAERDGGGTHRNNLEFQNTIQGPVKPLPWWTYGITFLALVTVLIIAVLTVIR